MEHATVERQIQLQKPTLRGFRKCGNGGGVGVAKPQVSYAIQL